MAKFECVGYYHDTSTNKIIKYYQLVTIGKYNIENNVQVQIPNGLKKITWWDLKSSVYTFIKIPGEKFWIELE